MGFLAYATAMSDTERLAAFVERASYDHLSERAREQLKNHILDALGCAIGALDGEPIRLVREQLEDFGGSQLCTVIGGEATAPDRAALMNGALVRYLDFNDSYLAPGETCHPSDNLSAVLAAAEYAGSSGSDLLCALAVAYQVQCRLSDVAPVRYRGFDHTTQGAYAVAAGVSKALGLDQTRIAHAVAISGTAFNALRVTRTGRLSHWKGLAYPNTAFGATHAAFLAMRGVTGPLAVFEGAKGFMETISGPFRIEWEKENLERVTQAILKKYNAEIHSQSAIEGILELREAGLRAADVEQIELEIFDVAYHIIGGGEEGEKKHVSTKEEADHSLPYLVAVALLDGQVLPAQYAPDRIVRPDVQDLLNRVTVKPAADLSSRFPAEMPCRLTVHLRDGRVLKQEKSDYEGFHTRPASLRTVIGKFEQLASPFAPASLCQEVIDAVGNLENLTNVSELASLLARVGEEAASPRR